MRTILSVYLTRIQYKRMQTSRIVNMTNKMSNVLIYGEKDSIECFTINRRSGYLLIEGWEGVSAHPTQWMFQLICTFT